VVAAATAGGGIGSIYRPVQYETQAPGGFVTRRRHTR